jgi:DNA-binding FadR family transcriptional regulator
LPEPATIRLPLARNRLRLAQRRANTQHQNVLHRLGLSIVGGEFPELSILPGDGELLARYGVSRTVLREAMKTLSAKGMIHARARIGTRVLDRRHWNYFDPDILCWHAETGIDKGFLANLAEMRMAFEPEAAALAARRRTGAQIAELHAWISKMETAQSSGGAFVDADLRFHIAVAEASGNPLMRSMSALIEVALEITFLVSSPIPNTAMHAHSVARHRAIAKAIEVQDDDAARAAMRAVIHEGSRRVDAVINDGDGDHWIDV